MSLLSTFKNWLQLELPLDDFPEEREWAQTGSARVGQTVSITAATHLSMVIVRAKEFEDAVSAGETLRRKTTVIVNLEETETPKARRIIDFLSGVAYMIDGRISKIAANTYLLLPYDFDIGEGALDQLLKGGTEGTEAETATPVIYGISERKRQVSRNGNVKLAAVR